MNSATQLLTDSLLHGVTLGLVVTITGLAISLPIYAFRRAAGL